MKKFACFLVFAAVAVIFCGCAEHTTLDGEALIRIHIRANSNAEADQSVKLVVRDAITEYLTAEIGGATTFAEAYDEISRRTGEIESIANAELRRNGFDYASKVRLTEEFFPTRAYENVIVESGYYDALIVELGSGEGDNWWCVIYPPLCFVSPKGAGDVRYRSIIAELWRKFVRGEKLCLNKEKEEEAPFVCCSPRSL